METGSENGDQLSQLPPSIIRVETALSRYPAHRLSKKGEIDINITKPALNGEVQTRWEVSPNAKFGQPGPLAYKVDTLIVNRKIEEAGRPMPSDIKLGSLSEICKQLDLADSGKNRANVKEALRQNAFAAISAKIVYRGSDGTEQTLEADFTRYSVVFTGESFPSGKKKKADAVYILLNDIFKKVLEGALTRPLDYDYLKGLAAGPQRFYELLSYQIFAALKNGHPEARLVYSEFCTFAPQTRYFDSNRVHKQMAKIHAPHKESGYIAEVRFQATVDADRQPDWVMLYTPGRKAKSEFQAFNRRGSLQAPGAEAEPAAPPAVDDVPELTELERELVARGVTETTARKLCSEFGEERVRRQLELCEWQKEREQKEGKKIKNFAAYLTKAIRENYAAHPDFVPKAERERRRKAEEAARLRTEAEEREKARERRREEEIQRKVDAYWKDLSDAEQRKLEAAALEAADPAAVATFRENEGKNASLARMTLRVIRDPYIRRLLKLEAGSKTH
jgi:hypothetical protein